MVYFAWSREHFDPAACYEGVNKQQAVIELNEAIRKVAHAISADAAPGHDASGGTVDSLTEAVMGMTAGLFAIASAIESLADTRGDK